jgi:hypothetical protein
MAGSTYHGYSLPDGKHVTRDHRPFLPIVVDIYGVSRPATFDWGPNAGANIELAFNLLYDTTGNENLALQYSLLFNLEKLASLPTRGEWEMTADEILEWADLIQVVFPVKPPVRLLNARELVANFPRRKKESAGVKGNANDARQDPGSSAPGSGGSGGAPERTLPTATLESERLPAGGSPGKAGKDGTVKR